MTAPNIPTWGSLTAEQRACAVLDWCLEQGIDTSSIQAYQLAAAMAEANQAIADADDGPFEPSPMDYVHLVRVLAAFLRSRI
jgi:hypothetical protein